jgi:hypothetical protein
MEPFLHYNTKNPAGKLAIFGAGRCGEDNGRVTKGEYIRQKDAFGFSPRSSNWILSLIFAGAFVFHAKHSVSNGDDAGRPG